MCSSTMNTCQWNTGQNLRRNDVAFFVLALYLCHVGLSVQSDFIDNVSKQFFGFLSGDNKNNHDQNQQNTQDGFNYMFGSLTGQQTQNQPQAHPPPNRHSSHQKPANGNFYRQGYYPPPPAGQYYHPGTIAHGQPEVQGHYAHGQQQGFGQSGASSNETSTAHPRQYEHYNLPQAHYASHVPHHNQQVHYAAAPAVHHHAPPVVTEYHHHPHPSAEYHHHPPPEAEYHHEPPVLEVHHGPPPAEYHHYPEEHYHHPTHKPKRFHLSYNEPSPDIKIIDKHLRLPPVKFRFHINPKITITTNTKDPLEKKEKDHHHDIEPYPPPDAFSDHEAPPSYNSHKSEHYLVDHYPVEHYPVAHHGHPVEHYPVAHHGHPYGEPTYDLTHLNPHRSSGHYEPTFKIKTKPIIFTEPPPTRRTTTTTTARPTTSTTTTTTTTTRRPRSLGRSSLQARNPGFSVSFTQKDHTSTATSIQRSVTVSPSSVSSTTSRTSTFSGRERDTDSMIERKDSNIPVASTEMSSTSSTTLPSSTTETTRTSTSTTTTTPSSTTKTTTAISSTTTTTAPTTTTTTTTAPTTTTTTTTAPTTSTAVTTSSIPAKTTITVPIASTAKTATTASYTTLTSGSSIITSRSSTPAELTTARTTTVNSNSNEIDMGKPTTNPRRRLEPLTAEAALESSESVKVIETTMLIDGKNQTVRFYYITQPVKLPLDVFNQMTGQKIGSSGVNMVKLGDRKFTENENADPTGLFSPP